MTNYVGIIIHVASSLHKNVDLKLFFYLSLCVIYSEEFKTNNKYNKVSSIR